MSALRFNLIFDTSHPFKNDRIVALTAIRNAMVKFFLVVNRSSIHKGVQVSSLVISIGDWGAWRP
jgi:hypothetical protein